MDPIEDTVLLEYHSWGYFIEAPREAVAIPGHDFHNVERELIRMKRKKKKGKRGKSPTPVETGRKKRGKSHG